MGKAQLDPLPDRFNVLAVVDSYGWAWDNATRSLYAHLPPEYRGEVINYWDLFNTYTVHPAEWDAVLVYTYRNDMVLAAMNPKNTIVCVESDPSTVQMWLKPLYDRFSHLAGMSGKVYHHLLNLFEDKGPQIHLLRHGVDTDMFRPPAEPPDEFTVGWVGRADRYSKRYALAEASVRLAGVAFKPLKGLKDEGYVPHQEMPRQYRGMSAQLCTSLVEVHSLATYEGMACGVVPITTRVGDVEEYVHEGVSGLLLPYDAGAEEIAETVRRIRDSPLKLSRMRRGARATAEKHLSWGKVIPSWIKILGEVAGFE